MPQARWLPNERRRQPSKPSSSASTRSRSGKPLGDPVAFDLPQDAGDFRPGLDAALDDFAALERAVRELLQPLERCGVRPESAAAGRPRRRALRDRPGRAGRSASSGLALGRAGRGARAGLSTGAGAPRPLRPPGGEGGQQRGHPADRIGRDALVRLDRHQHRQALDRMARRLGQHHAEHAAARASAAASPKDRAGRAD